MKIALDAAAGDGGLAAKIEGAVAAAKDLGIELLLVGPAEDIRRELSNLRVAADDPRFEIAHASDSVLMAEEPAAAIRAKPNCSIMKACELVSQGKASGLVSAGNPGAAMAAALWHIKRIPGVLRPAMAAPIPTHNGTALLIDAGTNPDCKPWHLLQFAIMGSIYALHILKREKPRVGMLSMGRSEAKGSELVKEAIPLLKCSGLDFLGPIEGGDIVAGAAEVVVCDGFVGDVAVKLLRAQSSAILDGLDAQARAGWMGAARSRLLRGPVARLQGGRDSAECGGSPLLGINSNVVICRPDSDGEAAVAALKTARELAEANISDLIRKSVDEIKQNLETSRVDI